jgi:predicted acetyltransferase
MRIGSARVRVGGIGAVSTHSDYRKRGYMEQTVQDTLTAMHERNYDMTLLFGIKNFYHKFGYVSAWADYTHFCEVADFPTERPASRLYKFSPRSRKDLNDLYNAYYATTTGTAVRPTYLKVGSTFGLNALEGYLWKDATDMPAGYVIFNRENDQIECLEYCGDVEQTLRVLGMFCRQYRCKEVRFGMMPYNCDLSKRLRRQNCRIETYFLQNCGAMIRTVNLGSTLGKLTGELSQRLQASIYADWQGNLLIADTREQVMLSITNGQVEITSPRETAHSIKGGEEIAQLLIGRQEPNETVDEHNIMLSGDAAALIQVLFPAQYPTIHHLDHY